MTHDVQFFLAVESEFLEHLCALFHHERAFIRVRLDVTVHLWRRERESVRVRIEHSIEKSMIGRGTFARQAFGASRLTKYKKTLTYINVKKNRNVDSPVFVLISKH